jgi:hypothetical protein
MDANESMDNITGSLNRFVNDTGLLDPITARHGTTNQPRTYSRGSSRIDYILTSPLLNQYITRCGILPLHHIVDSDHRALYIDVELHRFLKGVPSAIVPQSMRGIQSNNPRAVQKYQQILSASLSNNNVMEKMRELVAQNESQSGLTPTQIEEFLQLENFISQAKLNAETQVQHISDIPWSPKLIQAQKLVHYWRSWRLELRHGMDRSAYRARMVSPPPPPTSPTMQEATTQLKLAGRALENIVANASDIRLTHLQELGKMYSNTGLISAQQAIKNIIQAETLRALFMKLRNVLGQPRSAELKSLLLNQPGSPDIEITDQYEMEEELNSHNIKHFSQADTTPFASAAFKSQYGITGTNAASTRLLEGHVDIDQSELLPATKAVLYALKKVTSDDISIEFLPKELRSAHIAWRESTTTSPSGLHLSHDKAVIRHVQAQATDDSTAPHIPDLIFELKAAVLNLAISNTIILDRWKTIVNIMIEKIPQRPHISKLSIIHLIESDFNMAMGILWGRRLMAQGERLHQFGDEQSGARKHKQCPDVLLLKHLTYSTMRLSKSNGTTFDNDAKSCYDRIVMLFASLASQRIGMPAKACELLLSTLSKVKYRTRTIHGVSDSTYHTTRETTPSTVRVKGGGRLLQYGQ